MSTETANAIPVGSVVTVGQGKKKWTVTDFWTAADGNVLASLKAVEGYSRTSVSPDRLREVAV